MKNAYHGDTQKRRKSFHYTMSETSYTDKVKSKITKPLNSDDKFLIKWQNGLTPTDIFLRRYRHVLM